VEKRFCVKNICKFYQVAKKNTVVAEKKILSRIYKRGKMRERKKKTRKKRERRRKNKQKKKQKEGNDRQIR